VKVEIDRMLDARIIEPVQESKWIIPMLVQEKNTRGIRICVDLRNLNDACLLGHVVCKHGLLVDPTKIAIILELQPPTLATQLRETLGHTGYYRKFIKGYAQIIAPMENLLKKEAKFQWNEDYQKGLDTLKKKLVTTATLIFPYWNKEFRVHADASSIVLGAVLSQPREGDKDHPIYFARRKLYIEKNNYTTTE
jgi:hypothetical protein